MEEMKTNLDKKENVCCVELVNTAKRESVFEYNASAVSVGSAR